MKDRFQSADYRYIVICLVLLAGSIWFTAGNFYRAFPEASIDFRVSRDDAHERAQQFLTAQSYPLSGYRDASSFGFDDDAKTFLERELGLEKANGLMGTRIRLWHWSFRWFRPQQKEEFLAKITPSGDFVGFEHDIAEDAARPDSTPEAARAAAEEFLRTRAHRDPAALDFVESSSVTRPHRVDRVFTWKERDFDLHDATYRVEVTMLGPEVGGYTEYLKIPDQWTRDYERLRSKNNVAGTIDSAVVLALFVGLLVILVMRVRRQDVRWRRAAIIGVVGMVLSFLAALNEFPLAVFNYSTTDSFESFVAQKLLGAVGSALGLGGLLFVLAAGAEILYREDFRRQVSLGSLFTLRGLRTKRFFLGALLGISLCAIFLAYQTGFYIVANKLGAWSPADVPYDDLLNTRFPWLFVLLGGYVPAISEEFGFRMFAIPFLRRLVRWMPAALVLAGFIWGFGHALYPNQPFYIRGLEVGIGGVALGLIMLRWGILPTLIWHYSVDAMYSALLLLRSHSLYFRLSGAASAGIFVVPLLIALVAYWRQGGFEPVEGMLNADEPVAPEAPPAAPEPEVHILHVSPLGVRRRAIALAVFAGGLALGAIPVVRFGTSPGFGLTPDQARAPADAFLHQQGFDPDAYQHVTYAETHWGGDDSRAAKYFLEHGSIAAAANLFQHYRPVNFWATRYFKPLDKEEYLVTVQPETGKVMGYNRQIPDDRPGADLASGAARQIAETFAAGRGIDLAAMNLKESDSEKQKARRDYSFEWEAKPGDARNVGEVHYRVAIGVNGDRVSSLRAYWKIPEAFDRARDRQDFVSISVLALTVTVFIGAMVFAVWALVLQIRQGKVPWRRTLLLALVPTVMTAIALALSFHQTLYRGYQTAVPFATFTVTTSVVLVMGVLFAYVMYGAAIAFVLSHFPESLSAFRRARGAMALDALILLLMAFGLWHGYHQLAGILTERFHSVAILNVDSPALIGLPLPALAALAEGLRSLFSRGAILAILILAWQRVPKRWMLAPLALAAACTMVSGEVRTFSEFALEYALALAAIGAALIFCLWFARRNYLAYALIIALGAAHAGLAELVHSGNSALQTEGLVGAGIALVALAWAVGPGLFRSQPQSEPHP